MEAAMGSTAFERRASGALSLVCGLAGAASALGAHDIEDTGPAITEGGYSLFHPQPRQFWREMSADRPDTTESPFTVPPGAVQLEMSFVDYAKDGDSETWTFGASNLKLGLSGNVDFQLVLDSWIHSNPAMGMNESGVGDSEIRLKINLWGNDGERDTALALMPYIKFPTAQDELG